MRTQQAALDVISSFPTRFLAIAAALSLSSLLLTRGQSIQPGGLFAKVPVAPKAYVVDCRRQSESSRMSTWALQGLINQAAAEVYVISNPQHICARRPQQECGAASTAVCLPRF